MQAWRRPAELGQDGAFTCGAARQSRQSAEAGPARGRAPGCSGCGSSSVRILEAMCALPNSSTISGLPSACALAARRVSRAVCCEAPRRPRERDPERVPAAHRTPSVPIRIGPVHASRSNLRTLVAPAVPLRPAKVRLQPLDPHRCGQAGACRSSTNPASPLHGCTPRSGDAAHLRIADVRGDLVVDPNLPYIVDPNLPYAGRRRAPAHR